MPDLNFYRDHPRVPLPKNKWTLIGKAPLTLIANDEEPIVVYEAAEGKAPTTFDALNNLGEVVGVVGSIYGRTVGRPMCAVADLIGQRNVYVRGAYKDSSAVVINCAIWEQ